MKMKLKMQYGNYIKPADNIVVHARENKQKPIGNDAVKTASKFVQGSVAGKFLNKDPSIDKIIEKQWQTPPPFVDSPKFQHPISSPAFSTPYNVTSYKWDDDDLSSLEGGPLSPDMFEDEEILEVPPTIKSVPIKKIPEGN
jgi:hypothetical protein